MKNNKNGLPYVWKWMRVNLMLIIRFVNNVVQFLFVDIFRLDFSQLKSWQRRLAKDGQIVMLMLQKYSTQRIGPQATALSYQMTMSVVPFLAIVFFIASGFGLEDTVMQILQDNISDQKLLDMLTGAANTIVSTARSGLFGFVSIASFVWIVIWLMMRVQFVFTDIWRRDAVTDELLAYRKVLPSVSSILPARGGARRRNRDGVGNVWDVRRILVVIGILILSPFVVILFFSGSVLYSNVLQLIVPDSILSESLRTLLGWLMFGAIAICIIAMMYKYIPAVKVRFRHAFNAAISSGIAFTVLQYLYLETQMMVTKLNAVYGVVAALPLFMVWMNFGWMIILYGAALCYAMQNLERTSSEDIREAIKETRPDQIRHREISDVVDDVEQRKQERFRSGMRDDENMYEL